jgi:predicted peptidase
MLRRTFLFASVSAAVSRAKADAGQMLVHRSGIHSATLQPESLLYLPPDYRKDMPLLLWLHGASLRGADVQMVKRYGPPAVAERRGDFPFVILSPQCPAGQLWTGADPLMSLVDEVMLEHRIDPKRVYLTGLSMGGGGAWFLGSKHADRFAAVVPMCGPTQPALWAKGLQKMPIWCFHGEKDNVVPLKRSKDMVKALKKVGNKPKFTIVKGKGHDITSLYYDDDIYHWLLSKKIRKPVRLG